MASRRGGESAITTVTRWQDVRAADVSGASVAVIDVLRWSTVVVTALANGAEAVECTTTPGEALALATRCGRDRVLLGGERESLPIAGFDVGNSPQEYARARIAGRLVVTTTTNGTAALRASRGGADRIVAAFVNLDAVTRVLADHRGRGRAVLLLAAGQAGASTPEDTACAAALAVALGGETDWCPVTREAVRGWDALGRDPRRAVHDSPHAAALTAAGLAADLPLCAALSILDLAPRATEGDRVTAGAPHASH